MGWKKRKCSFRPLSQWVKSAPTWRSCSGSALARLRIPWPSAKNIYTGLHVKQDNIFLMPSRRYKSRATATNGSESSSGSTNGYIEDSITRSNQISSAHRVSCRFLECTFCASLEFYTLFCPKSPHSQSASRETMPMLHVRVMRSARVRHTVSSQSITICFAVCSLRIDINCSACPINDKIRASFALMFGRARAHTPTSPSRKTTKCNI